MCLKQRALLQTEERTSEETKAMASRQTKAMGISTVTQRRNKILCDKYYRCDIDQVEEKQREREKQLKQPLYPVKWIKIFQSSH